MNQAKGQTIKNKIAHHGYDYRLAIWMDICEKLTKLNIVPDIVFCYDGEEKKPGILSLLATPTEENLKKERLLLSKYKQIKDKSYSQADAKKDGIEEGFLTLNFIIESEGLSNEYHRSSSSSTKATTKGNK